MSKTYFEDLPLTVADPEILTPVEDAVPTRGSVRFALEAARIGRELGPRYTVAGLLGRGGFASVWEVLDGVVAERLAAKRFESDAVRSSGFYREMSALFRLDHPNIVRIVNLLDVSEITRYLFLEYCPGGTLRDLLRIHRREGRSIPLETLSRMAIELARGLHYAHRLGLIHRDLKPENILFASPDQNGEPGTTKLADFGLVRALRSGQIGGLSRLSGTPAYIAPEQISGQFSTGSDLYALGIVLFEALHGRTPFEGSPEEIALQHLNRPPTINTDLPQSWVEVLSALLEKDPANRPDDASWVIDRLAESTLPEINLPPIVPSTARCLGVQASAIVAEGTSGVLVLTSLGLFRFRHSTATRSGIVHGAVHRARPAIDDAILFASGCHLMRLSSGETEPQVLVSLTEPIDDVAVSRTSECLAVVRTGSILWHYEASESVPRLLWSRELAGVAVDSLAQLDDGRVALAIDGQIPQILILDHTGETIHSIDLPGLCENLLPLGDGLVARLRVNGVASAYRIAPDLGTIESLKGSGELVALAVDTSDFNSITGLFISGEIVRWNSTGDSRTVGQFPEEEGPFLGLSVSGELLWGLSARNDSTWLMVRRMNPSD